MGRENEVPGSPSARRKVGGELVLLLLALVAGAFLLRIPGELSWTKDAEEYRAFADAIAGGELFTLRGADVPKELATRTPGFPLLLVLARALGPDGDAAVRALHVALGVISILLVPLLLRALCPVGWSAAFVLVVLHGMRGFLAFPLTEWTAGNVLLWTFALAARQAERPGARRLVALGLVASLAVLTRPALIAVGLFPLGFALLRSDARLRARLALALLSLAPVYLWMGFNLWRLGSFTLTPFAGPNLFGVAALVGHASPREGDDPELVHFIEEVNAKKTPRPGAERPEPRRAGRASEEIGERPALRPEKAKDPTAIYNRNVHNVAVPIAEERGWDWMTFNRLLLAYSFRSIAAFPGAYARHVLRGLATPLKDLLLVSIPVLLIPIWWLARRRHRGLALATLAFALLHLAHLALCAAVEIVIPRYRELTFRPLVGISVLTLGLVATALARRLLQERAQCDPGAA